MDKQTFTQEVWAQREGLLRYAYSILRSLPDAEDAVSEAVLRAWEKRDTLRDRDSFRPWLGRIVRNCCYSQLRRGGRVTLAAAPEAPRAEQPDPTGGLWQWLSGLPQPYREALTLHYEWQLTTREMAQLLRLPKGTVTSRLKRGRALLARQMEREKEDTHEAYIL